MGNCNIKQTENEEPTSKFKKLIYFSNFCNQFSSSSLCWKRRVWKGKLHYNI